MRPMPGGTRSRTVRRLAVSPRRGLLDHVTPEPAGLDETAAQWRWHLLVGARTLQESSTVQACQIRIAIYQASVNWFTHYRRMLTYTSPVGHPLRLGRSAIRLLRLSSSPHRWITLTGAGGNAMSIMGLTAVGTAFAMIVASTQARGRSPADAQQRRCAQDLSISCFWRALAVACTLAAAAGGFPTACLGRDDAEPGRHNSARCETENPADLDIQSEHGKCKPQLAGNWWPQFRSTSVRDGVYVGVSSITESDAQDLTPIWKAPTGGPIFSSPSVASVANGIAYVGSLKGTLNAFNAATGALLWINLAPSGPDELMSCPAVANGVVYIGGGDARVHAFNATTGAPVWTTLTGGPIISSPTVVNGVVYVGSDVLAKT